MEFSDLVEVLPMHGFYDWDDCRFKLPEPGWDCVSFMQMLDLAGPISNACHKVIRNRESGTTQHTQTRLRRNEAYTSTVSN
jgi:hypothetical protein